MSIAESPIARSKAGRLTRVLAGGALLGLLATPAVADELLEVRGRVVRAGGQGLPGAVLELEPLLPLAVRAERQLAGRESLERVARSRSDAGGNFRVTVPEPGFWRLLVARADYLPARRDLSPIVVSEEVGSVILESRSELSVRVMDADGGTLPEVSVAARGWSERWRKLSEDGWWPQDQYRESGSDGIVRVPCGRDERVSLAAFREDRFAHAVVSCADGNATLELRGELAEAVVVGAGGAGRASVASFIRWPFLTFAVSDQDGRLRGPWRPEDPVPIAFADGSGFYGEPRLGWTVEEGEKLAVFQLQPTVAVTGKVVDAITGEPVPRAWLWLGRGSHHFLRADARGQFVWNVPSGRRIPLHAAAPGYLETVVPEVSGTESWGTVVFRLAPSLGRRGRVVDAIGRGIPDAEIRTRTLHPSRVREAARRLAGEGRWTIPESATRSDASGSFEIDRLAPHVEFEVTVTRGGFAARTVQLAPLDPGQEEVAIEIVLEQARNGFGRVVDVHDEPVAGAEVELLPALVGSGTELDFAAADGRRTHTDAGGRFLLADLASGIYYLAARGPGYPEVLVPGLEIAAGTEAVDLGTVVLSPGVRLHGRLRDREGLPLGAVDLQVRSADGEQIVVQRSSSLWFASATSRADGSYEIAGLPAERRLTLLIVGDGLLPEEVAVTTSVSDLELDLVLERGARLAGWVVEPDGAPAAGAEVELSRVEPKHPADVSTRRSAVTGARGDFEADGLRAGIYEIVARRGEGVADPLRLEVPGHPPDGVELRLRTRGVLEGRVSDPDGLAVARVLVRIEPLAGAPMPPAARWLVRSYGDVSDERGRFRIVGVLEGSYRVTANHPAFGSATTEVAMAAGGRRSVELRFEQEEDSEPAFEISGRIVDASGTPLEGVKVTLSGVRTASGAHVSQVDRSRADGTFRLAAVAGEYRLICQRSGFARYQSGAFEIDGDLWDFAVTLEPGASVVGSLDGLDFDELARVVIVARGEHDHHYGTLNYEGDFRIPDLSPGRWTVRAELLNPTRAASATVEIAPGDDQVRVDLRFEPGYRITGRAFRDGLPMTAGTVRLWCPGEFRGETFTDEEGRFEIDNATEGSCTAVLSDRRSGRSARREFELSGDLEIVLEILPAGE